jgi:hypothetical protein
MGEAQDQNRPFAPNIGVDIDICVQDVKHIEIWDA